MRDKLALKILALLFALLLFVSCAMPSFAVESTNNASNLLNDTSESITADSTPFPYLHIPIDDDVLFKNHEIEVALADSPWPMFGHDPQHTGQSPYIGPQTNNSKWSIKLGTEGGTALPAIGSDGTIYASSGATRRGSLYAIYPNSTIKWSAGGNRHSGSTPAIASDGTIYITEGYIAGRQESLVICQQLIQMGAQSGLYISELTPLLHL